MAKHLMITQKLHHISFAYEQTCITGKAMLFIALIMKLDIHHSQEYRNYKSFLVCLLIQGQWFYG